MPTWTFTTTDPATALQLSTFCVGLGHVTETETPDKPAPVQTRRKAAPIDHGCWRDPEARKVRAKVNTWVNARLKNLGQVINTRNRRDTPEEAYADAMGWTKEKAAAKIKAHQAHLDANTPEYRW